MKTIEELAAEAVNKINPSLQEMIQRRATSTHPEIIHGREAMQRQQDRMTAVIREAIEEAVQPLKDETRRADQLDLNCTWLVDKIDRVHAALCLGHRSGKWQQRAEQAVEAAEALCERYAESRKLADNAMETLGLIKAKHGLGDRHVMREMKKRLAELEEESQLAITALATFGAATSDNTLSSAVLRAIELLVAYRAKEAPSALELAPEKVEVGMWVTVLSWSDGVNQSWVGTPLTVLAVDLPFVSVMVLDETRGGWVAIDTRRVALKQLSPEFVASLSTGKGVSWTCP